MRRGFILCLLLYVCAGAYAQSGEFSVSDGGILWRRVYVSQLDSAGVAGALIASGQVADVVGVPGGVACRILPRSVDYRGAGFKRGAVAGFLLIGQMEGHAAVLVREGRYRVTVDRLVCRTVAETRLSRVGAVTPLEEYALNRKGEIKEGFYSMNAAAVLDYDLGRLFSLDPVSDEEDW